MTNRSSSSDRRVGRYRRLTNDLLDRSYNDASIRVLRVVAKDYDSPKLKRKFQDLERAERDAVGKTKAERDKLLKPILRDIAKDVDQLSKDHALLTKRAAETVATEAINIADNDTAYQSLGKGRKKTAEIGVSWNSPDPEAVRAVISIVDNPAFRDRAFNMGDDLIDLMFRGILEGQGPLQTARDLRDRLPNIEAYKIKSLMRTTQLVSYRKATAATQALNARLFAYQIRVSARDRRTCVGCWALHGEIVPIGTLISDHESGRCRGIAVLKGAEYTIPTGPEIWALPAGQGGISDDWKINIAGYARFKAIEEKAVQMKDFVEKRDDPVFDEMITVLSLKGVLGKRAARKYYYANQ